MQIETDLVIRKVRGVGTENPGAGDVYEARLVNPTDHSEVYVRGSWEMTEADAIENVTRKAKAKVTFK